jgi:hypothetical protein
VTGNLSRRHLLKSVGTAGLAALAPDAASKQASASQSSSDASRATSKSDLVRLSSDGMIVTFDRRQGTLYSITDAHNRQIEDTTGLVKSVPVSTEGLEPCEYRVRTERSELRARASEKLEFEVPVEDANSLYISRAVDKGSGL